MKTKTTCSRRMPWVAAIWLMALTMATAPTVSYSKVLDPQNRGTTNCRQLAYMAKADFVHALEIAGIDVLFDWNSDPGSSRPLRTRLAPLTGFPSEGSRKSLREHLTLTGPDIDAWMQDFASGTAAQPHRPLFSKGYGGLGAILIPGDASESLSLQEFQLLWELMPQERKVFISYTMADYPAAKALEAALREQGYLVYNFLSSAEGTVTSPARTAGWFFKDAGVRLVLDSEPARRSRGIAFEARFDAVIGRYAAAAAGDLSAVPRATVELFDSDSSPYKYLRPAAGDGGIILGMNAVPDHSIIGGAHLNVQEDGRVCLVTDKPHGAYLLPEVALVDYLACARFVRSEQCLDSVISIYGSTTNICANLNTPHLVSLFSASDSAAFDTIALKRGGSALSRITDQSITFRCDESGLVAFRVKLAIRILPADSLVRGRCLFTGYVTSDSGKSTLEWDSALYGENIASCKSDVLCERLREFSEIAGIIGLFRWLDASNPDALTAFVHAVDISKEQPPHPECSRAY